MTHQILQSDIDLARNLIAAGLPDDEIIAALVRRRIHPEPAALLVSDLRNGIPVSPQLELNPEGILQLPDRSERLATPGEARASTSRGERASGKRRRRSRPSGGRSSNILGVLTGVLLIVVGLSGGVVVLYKQYHARTGSLLDYLESIARAPAPRATDSDSGSVSNHAGSAGLPANSSSAELSDYQSVLNQLGRRRL